MRRVSVTDDGPTDLKRPATARPRSTPAEAAVDQEQPSHDECVAIERALAELPRFSGAVIRDVPSLGVVLAELRGRGPGYNFCACPRWEPAEVASRLESATESMAEAGEWPAIVVAQGVSEPDDLAERLTSAGWVETERERILWTRIAPGVPHLDPTLRLEAVTSRTAADYERVEREIFGLPDDFAAQRTAGLVYAISAGWLRAYLVRLNGQPVASTRLAMAGGISGIFGVGVVAEERRRGLGTLVTAVATRAGLAGGSKLVWLSVNETNVAALGAYRRLGFQPAFTWSRWVASI